MSCCNSGHYDALSDYMAAITNACADSCMFLPSSRYSLRIYKRFSQIGSPEPLLGVTVEGPEWYHWILRVWFLISHHLCPRPYIEPFLRYSLRYVQRRYIWLPVLHLTPDGGVTLGRSEKILHGSSNFGHSFHIDRRKYLKQYIDDGHTITVWNHTSPSPYFYFHSTALCLCIEQKWRWSLCTQWMLSVTQYMLVCLCVADYI